MKDLTGIVSTIFAMKVNTSVKVRDLLENFPKSSKHSEVLKHFASEYGKIKKKTFPAQCFTNFAIKFRHTYVKKFSSNKKVFYRSATSFLNLSVSVSPDRAVDTGDGDVDPTPPRDTAVEGGLNTPPARESSNRKPFAELSRSQKHRRVKKLRSKLNFDDKLEGAAVIKELQKSDTEPKKKLSNEQLLSTIAVLDLSVDKYDKFRALTGKENVSHYNTVVKYRDSILPNVQTTDNSCTVTLREMVHNTVKRLLEYLSDKTDVLCDLSEEDRHSLLLIAKLGSDGQADQANYKTCETMRGNISDSAAFTVGFVPLFLKTQGGRVLWVNPAPNSPFICRNLVFSFTKETDDVTYEHYVSIKSQIAELEDLQLVVNNQQFTLLAAPSTYETTMYDGKSVVAITRKLTGRAVSTQSCQLCFKQPNNFQNASPNESCDDIDSTLVKLGISCLHMWIRCMEYLFNISIRRQIDHRVSMTSVEFKQHKEHLQSLFRQRLQLDVFKVKPGAGNTNDGNTARKFFNSDETAEILNIPLQVLHLFRDLITMLNNPHVCMNEREFTAKARDLFSLLTSPEYGFNVVPMSSSVHKLLCHGITYVKAFDLPIGMLSESAIEARNKSNKTYRCKFAFQGSLRQNVKDTGVRLLFTSDPYIFMTRSVH